MRKLRFPVVALLLTLAFIVTGCGGNAATTTPTATTPVATSPVAATSTAPTSTAATVKPTATNPSATVPVTTTPPSTAKSGGLVRDIEPGMGGQPLGAPWEMAIEILAPASIETPLIEHADGSITPKLASSYDVVTDAGKASVTLHFRKGVKFSDGTDLNAQAVKWNFDKQIASKMYPSVTNYWKSLEVLDDYTLRVNFTEWLNKSAGSFSRTVCYVVSPTAFEKNGIDWMRTHMVGTGAFLQTDFQRDVLLTTVKNTNYWDPGKPYLDKFQILTVADELTRVALFKSGGGEILNCNVNGRVAQDLQNSGYKMITMPSAVYNLDPDSANADSPWSNLKVRQAAEYAIDKDAIVKALGFGFWTSAYQMNASNSASYDPTIPPRKYDVAKAKQLLTEAGYPNGFKTSIIVRNTENLDAVVAVQSYLGKVGIQASIQSITAGMYALYATTGEQKWNNALLLEQWAQNPNPTQGWNAGFGVKANSKRSVARPTGWGEALDACMMTAELQPALAQKVMRIAYDNCMVIPLYEVTAMWALAPGVQDTALGTGGSVSYYEPQNIWLKK